MTKFLKVATGAALLMLGASAAIAQTTEEKKDPPAASNSGAVRDEKPTDPNQRQTLPEVKKQEKQEGSKN